MNRPEPDNDGFTASDGDQTMKIAVLGAGAGGSALAFDYASFGHEVSLFDFPDFPDNIRTVAAQGGIHAAGDISGFGKIDHASHDIDAVLSRLAGRVVSVERIPKLAARARSALDALGVTNVVVHLGDGSRGRPGEE